MASFFPTTHVTVNLFAKHCKSLSQIALIAFCLETTLQTYMLLFLYSFVSVVLGPLALQFKLYLLRVFYFYTFDLQPLAFY